MRRVLASALLIIVVAGGFLYSATRSQSFPHEKHQGLFPTCEACHSGIYSGDETQVLSVTPSLCGGCHNGTVQIEVDWDGYTPTADNLKFTHSGHPQLPCATCHKIPDVEGEMAVQAARPASCVGCHGGGADSHLAAGMPCEKCHVPVTQTELTTTQIALFPMPPSHSAEDFLASHPGLAAENIQQCSVCHARESCTVCHLNADLVPEIQALGTDKRIAALVASKEGRWPTPESHLSDDWIRVHGGMAEATPVQCSDCHAQQSCENCHAQPDPLVSSVIAALPRAVEGGPQGVQTASSMPPHDKDFVIVHQTAAATESGTCASCHQETFCTDCHDASMAPSSTMSTTCCSTTRTPWLNSRSACRVTPARYSVATATPIWVRAWWPARTAGTTMHRRTG